DFPIEGVSIPVDEEGNPRFEIAIDPDGSGTVSIPFVVIDNAGIESVSANVIIPFMALIEAVDDEGDDINGYTGGTVQSGDSDMNVLDNDRLDGEVLQEEVLQENAVILKVGG